MKLTGKTLISLATASSGVIAFNMLGGILSARILGPDGRGELAALIFWPHLLAGIGNLSLNEVVVVRCAMLDKPQRLSYLKNVLGLTIYLSIATVAIGFLLIPYFMGATRAGLTSAARIYMIVFVPISIFSLCLLAFQQASLRFRTFNFLRLLQPAFYVLALGTVALTVDATALTVAFAALCSIGCAAILTWQVSNRPSPSFQGEAVGDIIKTGISFHFVNLAIFAATEFDRLTLVRLAPDADIGLYVVALSAASVSIMIVVQTAHAVLPPLLANTKGIDARQRLFAQSVQFVTVMTLAAGLGTIFLLPTVLPLLFGEEFTPSVFVGQILTVALAVRAIRLVIERAVRACGVGYLGGLPEIAALVVLIIFVRPALARYGIVGMASLQVAAQFAALAIMLAITRGTLKTPIAMYFQYNSERMKLLVATLLRRHS